MLIAKDEHTPRFEEGDVLDGYRVEGSLPSLGSAEERYAVRAEGGGEATLVAGAQPFGNRRERARFRELAALRMHLEHPALLGVRAFGEAGDRPYFVTDPQPARSLADVIAEEAPLEPERLVKLLAPVVEALDLGHERGLVHQSLEPRSFLVDGRGRLLVDTFGLAGAGAGGAWKEADPEELLYRSPEQLRSEQLAPAANVYALAAVIVHALSGEPAYGGGRTAIAYGHLVEPAPRMSDRVEALGTKIDRVLRRAMTKDPLDRPDSARALVSAVASALGTKTRPPAPLRADPEPAAAAPADEAPTAPPGAAGAVTALSSLPLPAAPSERRGFRGALVAAAAVAAVCGGLLAAALDPFGDEQQPRAVPAASTAAWERLRERRTELRGELAGADTPQEQAALAGSLAVAYDGAADASEPGPRASAAHFAAVAYSDLAAAANGNDADAYADAATAVDEAEERLARALRSPG